MRVCQTSLNKPVHFCIPYFFSAVVLCSLLIIFYVIYIYIIFYVSFSFVSNMATNQIQLKTLVDLALNCNEPGAVNFNYLRTLLLAILKLTNTDESFTEAKYVETDPVSEENESVSFFL